MLIMMNRAITREDSRPRTDWTIIIGEVTPRVSSLKRLTTSPVLRSLRSGGFFKMISSMFLDNTDWRYAPRRGCTTWNHTAWASNTTLTTTKNATRVHTSKAAGACPLKALNISLRISPRSNANDQTAMDSPSERANRPGL